MPATRRRRRPSRTCSSATPGSPSPDTRDPKDDRRTPMPLLPPDGALDLPGARVRSVGVSGQVDAVALEGPGVAARGDARDLDEQLAEHAVPGAGARVLAGALARADLRPVLAVPLDDLATAPGAGPVRSLDGEPAVELTVDAPPDGEGQVILEVDAAGVVSWHWAAPAEQVAGGVRAGLEQVFRIPVRQLDAAQPFRPCTACSPPSHIATSSCGARGGALQHAGLRR